MKVDVSTRRSDIARCDVDISDQKKKRPTAACGRTTTGEKGFAGLSLSRVLPRVEWPGHRRAMNSRPWSLPEGSTSSGPHARDLFAQQPRQGLLGGLDVGLRAAITLAAISRTRQCSSEQAATTAVSAWDPSHTGRRAGPRSEASSRRGLPNARPAPPGRSHLPEPHSGSASVRVPSSTFRHLRTNSTVPSRSAANATRRHGIDSWTMTPQCHHAEEARRSPDHVARVSHFAACGRGYAACRQGPISARVSTPGAGLGFHESGRPVRSRRPSAGRLTASELRVDNGRWPAPLGVRAIVFAGAD